MDQLEELRGELIRLGPWHLEVEVVPGLTTKDAFAPSAPGDSEPFGGMRFKSPERRFTELLFRIYPDGLEGRSVLDCACNCGAFSFFAKEAGAGECLGFDAREHWIEQARFLLRHRAATDGMRFEVCDLDDLPTLVSDQFDVTIFNGIFYHLPDPIAGLKLAADRTREVLIVNTATALGYPDGILVAASESPEHALSGVDGLNWFPGGPRVLTDMLRWMGFPATRCTRWRAGRRTGRTEVIATRDESRFEAFDATRQGVKGVREFAITSTPPRATLAVVSNGDARLLRLDQRQALELASANDEDAMRSLEELRDAGAGYLLVPAERDWPQESSELMAAIRARFPVHAEAPGVCRIFALQDPQLSRR